MYECIIVHSFFFSNFFNAVASYFFINKFTDEINTCRKDMDWSLVENALLYHNVRCRTYICMYNAYLGDRTKSSM